MPLIVITGLPSSLKTTRADELVQWFTSKISRVVVVTDDQFVDFNRDKVYSSPKDEKDLRSFLKSEVQKYLNKDTLVILDSMNYIKGYRYELHCLTKAQRTGYAVVWCDINQQLAVQYNSERKNKTDHYSESTLAELMMRYESPDSKNRWDSPLFVVQADDKLPFEQIKEAVIDCKPPNPNLSTVAQPLQPTNFMYELDRITSAAIKHIMSAQKVCSPGDNITLPEGGMLKFLHPLSTAELNKLRRQFITYTKMNPVSDTAKLSTMFAQYIQSNCQ